MLLPTRMESLSQKIQMTATNLTVVTAEIETEIEMVAEIAIEIESEETEVATSHEEKQMEIKS